MLIDPFTVGAQILNFLILMWLLRRVLYGPITRAMDERDGRIRHDIDNARRLQAEAAATREQLEQEAAAFASARDARLVEARTEIETWRRAQMDAARAEMDASRERWQRALVQEQRAAVGELRRRVVHEVLSLVRLALRDLADSELEERVVARFLSRLRELTPAERERLRAAAAGDGHRIDLRTSAPLADADRTRLRDAISGALGGQLAVHFDTATEPGGGVELRAGGLKVAWSLNEYLGSLEERLSAALGEAPEFDDDHA
jgi:F-type H+-transporting ATPase subunit b